jgi:hypothetical protein
LKQINQNRKVKFAYFIAALITLGLIVPAIVPAALPAYVAYVTALGGLAGLMFGANVVQKIGTKDTYIRELEMNGKPEDNNILGGTH